MNKKERRKAIRLLKAKLLRIRARVLTMHEEADGYCEAGAFQDASTAIDKAMLHLDELLW